MRLTRLLGGRAVYRFNTLSNLLALRCVLHIVKDAENPARTLALYYLEPQLASRAPGNPLPIAETAPLFYLNSAN